MFELNSRFSPPPFTTMSAGSSSAVSLDSHIDNSNTIWSYTCIWSLHRVIGVLYEPMPTSHQSASLGVLADNYRLQRGQCHNGTPSSALGWSIATKVIYFILADTNDVVIFFSFCRASQRYPSFESYQCQHWDFGYVEEYVIGRTNCSCWRCSSGTTAPSGCQCSGFEGTARWRPMHLTMFLYMPSMICMQILIVSRKRYFFFTIFPYELS